MLTNHAKTITLLMTLSILAGLFPAQPAKAQNDFYYPDGSLIKGSAPEVYFLSNGAKRWINSEEVFNDLQLDWQKILVVNDDVILSYSTGLEIKDSRSYPDGALIKGSTPEVYYMENGRKRWVPDEDTFLALSLWWNNIFVIEDEKLAKIRQDDDMPVLKHTPFRPQTSITEFPKQITEKTDIRFEYRAVSQGWDTSNIIYETWLEGKDSKWVSTSSKQYRTFKLPLKNQHYTFYVRAREKDGYADLTPARYQFEIKLSPYYNDITINGGKVKSSDYQQEYLELYNKASYPINLNGWTITSELGSDYYQIPEIYIVPVYASLQYIGNLELQPKGKVLIYTAPSALGYTKETKSQYGFRLNKCTGYLNNQYNFDPLLPKDCPDVELNAGQKNSFGSDCNDFIEKMGKCYKVDLEELNQFNSSCYDWIKENVNYEGCVNDHRYDNDFFKNQWNLYMGRTQEAWNNNDDTLILKDEQGLVVARYEY